MLLSTDGRRKVEQETPASELVLPRELTPLIAEGAIMEPLFVNEDWTKFELHGSCANITLPSKEDARASLWMEQSLMDGVRDYVSYECHDLRIVKVDDSGRLSLLVCKRVEPSPSQDGVETAPINGFWWSIGGRREIPKPGSPLDGKFGLIDSVLQKARREAGIQPENVLGIYDLGFGRTEFPAEMNYISKSQDESGDIQESVRNVRLANPQTTMNRNVILVVNSDIAIADQSVEHLTFITEDEYREPHFRAKFCEYEQKFIDAIFDGWNMAKTSGRALQGSFES